MAIYPSRTGFVFAVVERPHRLLDWGEAELIENSDRNFETRVALEIERHRPSVVALVEVTGSRRGETSRRRTQLAASVADRLELRAMLVSAACVRAAIDLGVDATKRDIARRISQLFPELEHRLPSNDIWQRDPWLDVFYTIAIATMPEEYDEGVRP